MTNTYAKARILLVDDEIDLLQNLGALFNRAGYNAEVAGNVDDALKMLNAQKFDVIITDIKMPGGSGLDLVWMSQMLSHQTPIFIISGNYCPEDHAEIAKYPLVRKYFSKPLEVKKIFQAIDQLVSQSTAA